MRSVQERLRPIFSQNVPKLVRVNKKFIIWLCLTLYYLKSEPWRIGMNETVYKKAFKTQQFYFTHKIHIAREKVKIFKETVSFHSASDHSNYLNQMYFHIFYIRALPARH